VCVKKIRDGEREHCVGTSPIMFMFTHYEFNKSAKVP